MVGHDIVGYIYRQNYKYNKRGLLTDIINGDY
jgi:hypothetical protein